MKFMPVKSRTLSSTWCCNYEKWKTNRFSNWNELYLFANRIHKPYGNHFLQKRTEPNWIQRKLALQYGSSNYISFSSVPCRIWCSLHIF